MTTLHEVAEKEVLLYEMRRMLAPDGTVCLIEFIKARTPMGPPSEHRLGARDVEKLFSREGFDKVSEFQLGENFYCQTYRL